MRVDVPSVTGADEKTARHRLGLAGLRVRVVYNTPADMRLDVVAKQDAKAKSQMPKGSTVTIFVS